MNQKVGLIGVGLMGQGIANNLQKHGFPLTLLHHPGNQPTDHLVAAGAQLVPTPAEVATAADVIILVVTGAPEVQSVLTAEHGLLAALRPGTVIVDCSTSKPKTSQRLAAKVEAAGGKFIDAPMTGLAKQAAEGTLNVLVGGDPAVLESVRPVLEAFTRRITHVGPAGAGHRMKLLHNFVSVGQMALIAEAAAHAGLAGVDPNIFVEVLQTGGGYGAALDRLRPALTEGNTKAVPFAIANAAKDLRYYTEVATETGAPHTIAAAIATTLTSQANTGPGQHFMSDLPHLLQSSPEAATPGPTG